MRLIYKCLHCGQARDETSAYTGSWFGALNIAYSPESWEERERWGIKAHVLHPCEPHIVGVAQLIAVIND